MDSLQATPISFVCVSIEESVDYVCVDGSVMVFLFDQRLRDVVDCGSWRGLSLCLYRLVYDLRLAPPDWIMLTLTGVPRLVTNSLTFPPSSRFA